MKKLVLLFCVLFITCNIKAQAPTKCFYDVKKKPVQKNQSAGKTKLVIKFIGPTNKPAKSHIKLTINKDSVIPEIDSAGIYTTVLSEGKYKFKFFVPFWYDVITDTINCKSTSQVYLTVRFKAKDVSMPGINYNLGKPVIYVYPQKPTEINMTLHVKGDMTFSYPKYNTGWHFTAYPNGNIECKNRNYNYLFWEGEMKMTNLPFNWTEGFIVKTDTLLSFFENTLPNAGLNEREMQDFITYWVPKMQTNKYNYIHFVFNKDYDYFAKVEIEPEPKNLIRVFVVWGNADITKNYPLVPQTFPSYSREGYTIIEWGGGEINNILTNIN